MSSLVDQIMASLGQAQVQRMSSQLGATPAQTQSAIQAAIPLLMGALGRNAASPQGAESLLGALNRDHAGTSIGGLLQGLLGGASGGGQPPAGLGAGEAILRHVLGGRQQRADQGISASSGLGVGQSHQLLAMLAPIVMAVLGRQAAQGNLNAGALGALLGQEQKVAQQAAPGNLLNAVLDQDGDGEISAAEMVAAGSGLLGSLFGKR